MTVMGVGQSFAQYSTDDLVSAGWEAVDGTTVELTDLDSYYYLLVDGTETNKVLTYSGIGTDARPVYQLLYDPTVEVGQVWTLEASGDMFKLKSYANDWYYCSNSWGWNSYMGTNESYTEHDFVLNDGKYYIHVKDEGGTTRALGAWNNYDLSGGGLGYAGTAGNKDVGGSNDRGFYIYRLPRTDFTPAAKPSSDYAAAGWMEVTAAADWGRADLQYVFLDISETGWETDKVVTATENGLPQYQRSDMANKAQWWTTEASGEGYAFKSVEYGTYSNYTAPWGGNMSEAVPGNVFVPSLANGKWAIKNTSDNSHWWGRWGDNDNGKNSKNEPFAGENMATNKGVNDGRRLFSVYAIPAAVEMAEALPATGDMEADTWYFFDIDIAGSSYAATATTLDDIECIEYATGNEVTLEETDNTLAATRYYVKSTTANNLVVAATSYSYVIGEPQTDVAEGAFVQPGQTITVTFPTQTDDPSAELTMDFSGVTFTGELIMTTTPEGFSFVIPSDVEADQELTLTIPAGAVSYAGQASSEAAEFTFRTPVLFDGVYYFRNTDPDYEYKYIGRGTKWSTRAMAMDFGLATYISLDSEGRTAIQIFDNDMYLGDDGEVYTDCTGSRVRTFFVEKVEGGYKFKRTDTRHLAIYNGIIVADGKEGDNLQGTTNVWALETPEEYAATCYERNTKRQLQTAIDAAGIDLIASTGENLEAQFTFARKMDITPIERTSAIDKYAPESEAGGVYKYVDQTVTGLAKGIYKLKFKGMQRAADYPRVDKAFGARGLIYAYANDAQTQLVSVMEQGVETEYESNYHSERTGLNYPNNSTSTYAAFDAGLYDNEVYVYVSDGTLNFGIANPSRLAGNFSTYVVYGDFELTYFYNDLTGPWKDALATAKEMFANEAAMAPSLRTALGDVIDTYDEGKVDETSQEALDAATNALLAATAKCEVSVASYAVITAGSLPNNSVEGWAKNNNGDLKINTWSNESNNDGGSGFDQPFIENWLNRNNGLLGAGELYYHLEGLEPGEFFFIEMDARACRESDTTQPVDPTFYANDATVALADVGTFHEHNNMSILWGTVSAVATIGEDGVLEFGIRNTDACNYNWNAVRNVHILSMADALAEAVAEAEDIYDLLPKGMKNELEGIVTENDKTYETGAEYLTAIENIKAATEEAKKIVPAYEAYLELKDAADELSAAPSDNDDAHTDLLDAIDVAVDNIAAVTNAEAAANVNETLRSAMVDYITFASPTDPDYPFNLTFMLKNPELSKFASDTRDVEGWYTDQTTSGQNFRTMVNGAMGPGDEVFMEYWSDVAASDGFTLYQLVTLPEGTYRLSARAGLREARNGDTKHVTLSASDIDGVRITSETLEYTEFDFVNAEEQELKLGMKAHADNYWRWMGINDMHLYKVVAQDYYIDEMEEYDYSLTGAGEFTIYRTLQPGVNMMVLPISLTADEVEDIFGAGALAYTVEGFEDNNVAFISGDVVANEPFILWMEADGIASDNTYEAGARTLVPAESEAPMTTIDGVSLVGNYLDEGEMPIDVIGYTFDDKLALQEITGAPIFKCTEAYITIEEVDPERPLTATFDGIETAISSLTADSRRLNGEAYDLTGRRVQSITKGGMYIINGKKVFVK